MSDNQRRYRTIKNAIKELYPTEPKGKARHLHTLAAMISGIVGSKSVNLSHIERTPPVYRFQKYRLRAIHTELSNHSGKSGRFDVTYASVLAKKPYPKLNHSGENAHCARSARSRWSTYR